MLVRGYINRRTIKVVKMLRRLRYTVPSCVIRNLYTTIVLLSLDYCDVVWAGYVYEDCCKEVASSANSLTTLKFHVTCAYKFVYCV